MIGYSKIFIKSNDFLGVFMVCKRCARVLYLQFTYTHTNKQSKQEYKIQTTTKNWKWNFFNDDKLNSIENERRWRYNKIYKMFQYIYSLYIC